jgi:putative transposase
MRLTYRYRLLPTHAQRTALDATLDACRWIYNKTLETRKDAWDNEQVTIGRYDTMAMIPQWKLEYPSLDIVYSQALQEVCTRVDLAFKAFFRRVKAGENPGYPRFKGEGVYDSFTFTQSGFKLDGNRLTLSKIGDIKIKVHRPVSGAVKTLTIHRDRIGNWTACFSCKCETEPLSPSGKVVGIDLGLSTFATMSDGNRIDRQRWMKRDADDIARLQRKKDRFEKGTPGHRRAVHALGHAHERVANRRRNFAHQESRKLVNEYQIIVFEDLDIKGMQSNGKKNINKGIADVAWGQFVQYASCKAANAGRTVVLVDPKNTTQMCSGCHAIVPKDLSVRIHDCPHCGLVLDRDLNAAINILARGLASLNPGSPGVVEAAGL